MARNVAHIHVVIDSLLHDQWVMTRNITNKNERITKLIEMDRDLTEDEKTKSELNAKKAEIQKKKRELEVEEATIDLQLQCMAEKEAQEKLRMDEKKEFELEQKMRLAQELIARGIR